MEVSAQQQLNALSTVFESSNYDRQHSVVVGISMARVLFDASGLAKAKVWQQDSSHVTIPSVDSIVLF